MILLSGAGLEPTQMCVSSHKTYAFASPATQTKNRLRVIKALSKTRQTHQRLIKNSSKSLENKIYNKKEAIILLDEAYNLAFLENNYLTSSKKLFGYLEDLQAKQYKPIDITFLKKLYFKK